MKQVPITLTIAGSDSGGGAGIQADLKTFSALETFGTTAITCLTAQNPDGVSGIHEVPASFIESQLEAILHYFPVSACKTGMLFSNPIIHSVIQILKKYPKVQMVVDPVMIATSGAKLLKDDAIESIKNDLIPMAVLITPNLDEASLLLGKEIKYEDEMEPAARDLFAKFRVPVLLKGGHLLQAKSAIDLLFDGISLYKFEKLYQRNRNTHGSGCTFSAAITAFLAHGESLPSAVGKAKEYIHLALEYAIETGETNHIHHMYEE